MPYINIRNAKIYYEDTASDKEPVLFIHGLLWSTKLYENQIAHLKDRYRCVAYDHRGQGQSEVTDSGYDMDSLYEDAVALIEALELGPCHVVGLSMGGFVAMRLAARRPDLIKSLILLETSADVEPNKVKYSLLVGVVKMFGIKAVTSQVMPVMFGKTFLSDPNREEVRERWKAELQANHKSIVKAVNGVIERKAVLDELQKISCPTLIMVGDEDAATVPAKAQQIYAHISHSQLVILKGAGHTSTIETPKQVNRQLDSFLSKQSQKA